MTAPNEVVILEQLTQQTNDLSIKDDVLTTTCACCGKEGNNLNACNKCDLVMYCNAACKKKHRSKHKKKCERRAAELHDIELFKQPPPNEDCPICMLPLPTLQRGRKYNECCGKMICSGCIHAGCKMAASRDKNAVTKEFILGTKVLSVRTATSDGVICPFCRTPKHTTDVEYLERLRKRIEVGDTEAIYNLGCYYAKGNVA